MRTKYMWVRRTDVAEAEFLGIWWDTTVCFVRQPRNVYDGLWRANDMGRAEKTGICRALLHTEYGHYELVGRTWSSCK